MISPLKLEALDDAPIQSRTVFLPGDRLAQIKSDALQAGYDLGYQTAQKELQAQSSETAAKIAQKIEDASFTHFEARNAVLKSLEHLVAQMVDTILPKLASTGLATVVSNQIVALGSTLSDGALQIYCPPALVTTLRPILATLVDLPVSIKVVSNDTLHGHNVRITGPECEREINLDAAIAAIRDSVSTFYNTPPKDQING